MSDLLFIQLLLQHREIIDNSLSTRTMHAISDFVFGYFAFKTLPQPILTPFQTWLGIELGIQRPSKVRGGLWIGDSIRWDTMLLRHYKSEDRAYSGFFEMIARYRERDRTTERTFVFDGLRQGTFLIKDYGEGLPRSLDTYSIEGHAGRYLRAQYANGVSLTLGYFSTEAEIEIQVQKTYGKKYQEPQGGTQSQ